MSFPNPDKVKDLLRRAFRHSLETGSPAGAVALKVLSRKRHDDVMCSPDEAIRDLSEKVSRGRHTILSLAYTDATLSALPKRSPERAAAFATLLQTGSPFPGLSHFTDWRND